MAQFTNFRQYVNRMWSFLGLEQLDGVEPNLSGKFQEIFRLSYVNSPDCSYIFAKKSC